MLPRMHLYGDNNLLTSVGMQVGDTVAVASSSPDSTQLEIVDIASVAAGSGHNGTLLGLSNPLNYSHGGHALQFNDSRKSLLDVRAEVGVLSRNVRVTARSGRPGPFLEISGPAEGNIFGISCIDCGQVCLLCPSRHTASNTFCWRLSCRL